MRLVDEAPDQAYGLIQEWAAKAVDNLPAVIGVVTELARDTRYEPWADNVLRLLRDNEAGAGNTSPEPTPVELKLPGSWFEGHPDPINDHMLFLRYLPEVRRQLAPDLPPVRVGVDSVLEPDGYRITVDGTLLKEGRVGPSSRYCSEAALGFLRPEIRSQAVPDPDVGLHRVPVTALAD